MEIGKRCEMKDILFMSVDLGTSFIKVGTYDLNSNCITIANEPVKDERPRPGIFVQYGEELFVSVINCMKKASQQLGERAKQIEAIAFTGQMAGFMGIDKEWNDITTWSCSLDTRYIPYAKKQQKQLAKEFLEISGTNSPQMASKYQWFTTEFPEEAKKIAKYIMISSYVIGKLGELDIEEAVIDRSFIAWTGLADIKNNDWSQEICSAIGLDKKYLPKIVKSDSICGKLSKRMAQEVGLQSGIPLISGAGDKVAGCVGAGVLDIGDMIFEAGSYGGLSCMIEEYRPDMKEHFYDGIGSATEGLYAHKYIPGSGITLDWFIETFAKGLNSNSKDAFQEMEEKVAKLKPGSDGVMAVGLLGGSAMPFDGDLKGMWMGYDWSHRQEHFYRALLESFSYELGLTIDRLGAMYPEYDFNNIKIIGGGAKSKVWSQMLADVTGKRFHKINREDIALWGAAILAGSGVGAIEDIKKTAHQYVGACAVYEPDESTHQEYQKYKNLYKEYLGELHDFYVRLKEIQGK